VRLRWSIREAVGEEDLTVVRRLFQEYEKDLGVDLCFQDFEKELAGLPGPYGRPRGAIFLAFLDKAPVGCVAVKPLKSGSCEMKRLYVRPDGRGRGIGRGLARRALREGQKLGYKTMKLDSLARMQEAIALYLGLGFQETSPYCNNPLPDAVFLERRLDT
jgi:ribosomal protein S18 acetylase RimI-like enzyme